MQCPQTTAFQAEWSKSPVCPWSADFLCKAAVTQHFWAQIRAQRRDQPLCASVSPYQCCGSTPWQSGSSTEFKVKEIWVHILILPLPLSRAWFSYLKNGAALRMECHRLFMFVRDGTPLWECDTSDRPFLKKKAEMKFRRSIGSLSLSMKYKSRSLRYNRTLLVKHNNY